jgi:hypothetical protein
MSIIYLLALAAVAVALLTVTASAIASVSRRPDWERHPAKPTLHAVVTVDRRHDALPFVGKERRHGSEAEEIVAPKTGTV